MSKIPFLENATQTEVCFYLEAINDTIEMIEKDTAYHKACVDHNDGLIAMLYEKRSDTDYQGTY